MEQLTLVKVNQARVDRKRESAGYIAPIILDTFPFSNTRSEEEQPSTSSSSMFGSSKPATVVPDPSETIQVGEEATESADEIRQRRLRRFAGETDA